MAMTLLEACRGYDADVKILATDISTRALARARAGIYAAEKMEKVPPDLRDRYFRRRPADRGAVMYEAKDELRRLVSFCRLNLSETPFPMKGPMDMVFCRNVMIYFDNDVRRRLLEEIERLLKPGGYLLVGHAESLTSMLIDFATVKPSIYKKPA